jgi:hypothetical protein
MWGNAAQALALRLACTITHKEGLRQARTPQKLPAKKLHFILAAPARVLF